MKCRSKRCKGTQSRVNGKEREKKETAAQRSCVHEEVVLVLRGHIALLGSRR